MRKVIFRGSDFLPSEAHSGGGGVLARMEGNRGHISFLCENFYSSMIWKCFLNQWSAGSSGAYKSKKMKKDIF